MTLISTNSTVRNTPVNGLSHNLTIISVVGCLNCSFYVPNGRRFSCNVSHFVRLIPLRHTNCCYTGFICTNGGGRILPNCGVVRCRSAGMTFINTDAPRDLAASAPAFFRGRGNGCVCDFYRSGANGGLCGRLRGGISGTHGSNTSCMFVMNRLNVSNAAPR